MITHKILQVVKKFEDGNLSSIYVQIEIGNETLRLAFNTDLDASAESSLTTAIEDFIGEKTVDFEEAVKQGTEAATEKARFSEVKVDTKTIHVNADKIETKANEVRADKAAQAVDAEAEITPQTQPPLH